jgi:hypothetical protein
VYTLSSSSVEGAFTNVVSSVGPMFALFHAAAGIAMAVYYRRLAARGVGAFLELIAVPLVSAGFLLWVAFKSVPGLGGRNGNDLHYVYIMVGSGYFNEPVEAYDPAAAGGATS